jgi:protocatechuate 3,4-dioxygenase beta subunit
MQSLVRHLHAFITDVGLTEDEWAAAIGVLTDTGAITTDQRQEFILWSDTLGVSMLVDALAHPTPGAATESTILGPFYVAESPARPLGSNMAEQEAGQPAWIYGRVLDTDQSPIAGAELDVWQNGSNQLYAVQDPNAPDDHLRGKFRTDDQGRYCFWAVRPVPYPIPDDGPVGRMLAATGRHPWRPAHVHLVVRAPGFAPVTTHIFDSASDYLTNDTVFAVKPSLVRPFVEHDPGEAPALGRPSAPDVAWASLELDVVLAPSDRMIDVPDRGRTH